MSGSITTNQLTRHAWRLPWVFCCCRWSRAVTSPGRRSSSPAPPRTPGRRGRSQSTPTWWARAPAAAPPPPPSSLTMPVSPPHPHPGIFLSRLTNFSSSLQTSKRRTSWRAPVRLPPTPRTSRGRPRPPRQPRVCTRTPASCTGAAHPRPAVCRLCQPGELQAATGRGSPDRLGDFILLFFSTPLPRRNLNKIITKDSSERIRKFSITEVHFISFYLLNFKNSEAQLWSTRDILKTVKWIKHDNVLWPSSIMFIILTHVDVLKPMTDCTYVEGRWQWRANDCVWPGSQALRWKRKRRKVSRKSPWSDFLQPPVWKLKLNLKLYFLIVFGGRYDKVSESLALRILNIKNIPRNNKDVSWIQ